MRSAAVAQMGLENPQLSGHQSWAQPGARGNAAKK